MTVIKCKMCGGDLVLSQNQTVAECEYCGSRQTVPRVDDERKLSLFARAERLRKSCEFDKASAIYSSIVADFPEEAEAYWGLVLCRYGIEYVDDPGTGKKIPTCHRSSFDSPLEDPDFEQAMENADPDALRVYRQEAKQIEELRRDILKVSSSEAPYDIFICYKETDCSGERSVDSLLAQDIYDALTGKGYRVFFSRISLEDKLGLAYEPYIFAALNSARIMLAVGTCYEHYNAVWVKNEWSRYLELMEKDKSKLLIPCYKGVDAYDMPREFRHLQAQDMGKVGALPDLLRGIEKLLPKQAAPEVSARVLPQSGSFAALLRRGMMALEDGDWSRADGFFEEVLNMDPECVDAYFGKALAQEACRTFDELIGKRRAAAEVESPQELALREETDHIESMLERYAIPGQLEAASLRGHYAFDLRYRSVLAQRRQKLQAEQQWWQEHRLFARVEQFGKPDHVKMIGQKRDALIEYLAGRVAQAEQEDQAATTKLRDAYLAHLRAVDEKIRRVHEKVDAQLYPTYAEQVARLREDLQPQELEEIAWSLEQLRGYRDSAKLAAKCREDAKADYEAQRKRAVGRWQRYLDRCKQVRIAMLLFQIPALVLNLYVISQLVYAEGPLFISIAAVSPSTILGIGGINNTLQQRIGSKQIDWGFILSIFATVCCTFFAVNAAVNGEESAMPFFVAMAAATFNTVLLGLLWRSRPRAEKK